MQAQAINHFHIRGFRKRKQAVQVCLSGQMPRVTVRGVAADAQIFDAERLKQMDERQIVRPKIMDASFVRQQDGNLKAQSRKIWRNGRAGVLRVEVKGYWSDDGVGGFRSGNKNTKGG